jgi:predicted kinase
MLGYPGAGKTTTAKVIAELTGAVHLWADHERRKKFGTPTYKHRENIELYDYLNQLADELLSEGKSVVYDTNFNFLKDRKRLREVAQKNGAETVLIWVTTPKHIAKDRATTDKHPQHTRVLGTMPEHAFERMSGNLQPPHPDEEVIEVDGTKVTAKYISMLLGLDV